EDRVPRRASRVTLAATVLLGAAALLAPPGAARLVWLVAAILVGELVASVMVLTRLRRITQPERFVDGRALRATLLAAAAMMPVSAATWWLQRTYGHGNRLGVLAALLGGGALAVGIYGLVLHRAHRPARHQVRA
ncbi:MAG: hypothetical protein J2P17_15830, partial [Mycobacterium sp.]|nr:hypothetical protein [Mycobacterium sp.]